MSRTKKILMIISLMVIMLIPTITMAKTVEYDWTDPETNIQFKISINENGKIIANPVNGKNWFDNITDYKKYREAQKRAQAQGKVIDESGAINGGNSTTDTTTKEDGQEERKEITETIEEIIEPLIKKTIDGTNKVLGWGGNIKCGEKGRGAVYDKDKNQGGLSHQQGTKRVDLSDLSIMSNGITIGKGPLAKWTVGKKVTFTPTYEDQEAIFNDAVYRKTKSETIGTTYETAAIAYIYSRVNDSKDNGNRIDNYQQVASWINGYFNDGKSEAVGSFTGGLLEEANAYQAYREAVEKWKKGNMTIRDGIVDNTVSTDIKNGLQKLGPYKLTYVRGYSNIQGREFVDFGGIKEIMLYNQDGKELPVDAWKIEFKTNRKIDENDKEYLSKFPASGEEFYIVLDISKLPEGTKKLSKISYKYRELHIKVDVDTYTGKAHKAIGWIQKIADKWNQPGINGRPETWATYTIWPVIRLVDVQKMEVILKIYKDEGETTVIVPPTKIPPYNPIIPPTWPSWPPVWPDRPTYPDYPDTDLTFTIAGFVWEDTGNGKEGKYDGVIGNTNSGTREPGIGNVEVKLYKHGTSEVIKTTYTDSNGAYVFNEIPVGTYDVGFVYDGMTYTTTKSLGSDDPNKVNDYQNNPNDEKYNLTSKTEENPEERQNFNDKFYEITADGAKNSAGNITNKEPLEYETSNGVSKIKTTYSDGKVKKDFQLETKTSNTLSLGYPFSDYVNNADTSKTINGQTYYANYGYMAYVNLGLKKREHVDFALTKDVSTSTITINNKQMTYRYNSRSEDAFEIGMKKDINYSSVQYNREVYQSDYKYRIDDYKNNTLNPVDGATLRGLKQEDQELKVFVTYKIKIMNQSAIYSGTINQLVDYFDSTYILIKADKKLDIRNDDGTIEKDKVVARAPYYTIGSLEGNLNVTDPVDYNSNYKKTYISGIENNIFQSGESIYLYLTFEVDKDGARAVKLGEKSNQVEITSYSTFEQKAITKSKPVGMIDHDSAPGNLDPENSATLEDDSDIAPTVNVKLYEGVTRTLNGLTWEDERNKTLQTGQKVGDGRRDDNETKNNKINGVRVQLVEKITASDGKQLEYIWQEMFTGETGYKYVDINGNIYDSKIGTVQAGTTDIERGEYKFSGYIPGDYIVRFYYGDTEKTALASKNKVSYNGQDYKSTAYHEGNDINAEWYDLSSTYLNNNPLSDAKDNADRRLEVINYSKTMKNDIAQVLASHENASSSALHKILMEKTYMYADTAKLRVEVEFNTTDIDSREPINSYNIRDIDFGIEERPEAKITLTKEIEGIKVTLADGSTLVDTEAGIKKNVQVTQNNGKIQGRIHIYMDEEVMQGATIQIKYKITVKNDSQIDYTGATSSSVGTTYYTGKVSNTDQIVTTSIDAVADYVDNSLVYRADDNSGRGWQSMEQTRFGSIEQMENKGFLDKNVKLTEKNIHQILINESTSSFKLKPGESKTLELLLSKTISSSDEDDDLSYDNIAEVLQYTNTVGRRSDIPGDQDPTKAPIEADADWTETVVITPPTGENRAHYFVLTGVILVVIAGGVFVIKKKVLDK